MKKIFDILPPKETEERATEASKELKRKRSVFRFWWVVLILLLAVSIGTVLVLSSRAELFLTLVITEEPLDFQGDFGISVLATSSDFQNRIIPGEIFEAEKESVEKYQATGTATEGGKAQGIIKVFNTHTPLTPITLREQTRFLSSQGEKIFRAPEKLYLPVAKIKDGKTIPGIKEVKVLAQEAGEDYNIGPSKFSVPGLVGTPLYYSVWAESEKSMEGGFKKEVKLITSQDIETAKNDLKIKLEQLTKDELKGKIPAGFVLKDKLIFDKEVDVSCFQKAEEKMPEFNCQGKMKVRGLAFQLVHLKEIALLVIANQIPPSKKISQETLSLNFSPQGVVSNEGRAGLDLKIEVRAHEEINRDVLFSQIQGKSREEIKQIISENYPYVKNIGFNFSPFWIRKAPKKSEKIELGLTFQL